MTNSRDCRWRDVREAERILFLLGELDERRAVIKRQAWHEGSFDAIWHEASAMRPIIAELKTLVGATYDALIEKARNP